jgi:hypothetical protein
MLAFSFLSLWIPTINTRSSPHHSTTVKQLSTFCLMSAWISDHLSKSVANGMHSSPFKRHVHYVPSPLLLLTQLRHYSPLHHCHSFIKNRMLYIHRLTEPTHFDLKGGGSIYLRNVGNIAHNHTMQYPKNRISINGRCCCFVVMMMMMMMMMMTTTIQFNSLFTYMLDSTARSVTDYA